jgi:hypothetical protein
MQSQKPGVEKKQEAGAWPEKSFTHDFLKIPGNKKAPITGAHS